MTISDTNLPSMSHLNYEASHRLRLLREALGLSRPKFADKLGIPPTTLKNYELRYREIGGGLFLTIANHPEFMEHTFWLLTGEGMSQLILTTLANKKK